MFNLSRFLQATPNVLMFTYAPPVVSTRYLHLLGSLYYIANRKERSLIEKNIMTVFKDRKDARKIVRKAFQGIFSHYSEKLVMAYRNYDSLKSELWRQMDYLGLEHLDRALEKGGVVLFTGHFGAVEFLPLALALKGYPVTMTVNFQTERLKKSLMERAEEVDVELIDCRNGDVMVHALDALRRGRILLTECDEVDAWKAETDRTIEAFGGHIRVDRALEVLARRAKATIIGSFMVRTGSGYCLNVVPVNDRTESPVRENVSVNVLRIFEQFVMMFPDQWYQWKKFHKMRPGVA